MKSMMFSEGVELLCKEIGMNLQSMRINQLNDTQAVMAERIGVSRRTYHKMEAGDPTVKIGYWLEAAKITNSMMQWKSLFTAEENLFDEFDRISSIKNKKKRKRATSRKPQGER